MVEMFRSEPDPDLPGIDVPGWMTPGEMRWLNRQARNYWSAVEVGCLVGRSTLALAGGCHGTVYAVDSWEGENAGAYEQFLNNIRSQRNIITMKMRSIQASALISSAEMVFLDGDHSLESVRADLEAWFPRTAFLICGHDFGHPDYPGVAAGVKEFFGDRYNLVPGESIWYYNLSELDRKSKRPNTQS